MSRTYGNAFTAQAALLIINICHIVLHGNCPKVTLFLTLATADTTDGTDLHRHGTFILVDTGDEHSPTLRTFLAQFDDVTRTSLDTCTTRGTLLVINLGDARLGIDADSIELTGFHTVATT